MGGSSWENDGSCEEIGDDKGDDASVPSVLSICAVVEAIGLVERPGAMEDDLLLLRAIWEKDIGSSGVREEQLDRELSEEDLIDGVEARELGVVVVMLEERDREERFGVGVCGCSDSEVGSGSETSGGAISSSITSTTLPSGATTS